MEELHERLKSLRIEHKLTQQDIADKLFVSRQAVSNWENNKNFPDLKSIVLRFELFRYLWTIF
ncbi:MAG: helix-turn-helix transcriptional regulator [Enterococcus sp.]|uniref:helix-turn-helix transcriptional regulator n=1 Tax=Candidatus Enterococcus wittei TaxID=1987383 RepID=UPI001386EF84|nr:helix-turn-helix transcriptional regulator [Enterococcus sp. 10A9_DIV0425]